MMFPSNSYESQLPNAQPGVSQPMIGSFGQVGASFGAQAPNRQWQQPGPTPQSFNGPRPQGPYAGSGPTYQGPGPEGTKVPECEQECAEEECDPEQCGDEHRGPDLEHSWCGVDTRPLLPICLGFTTAGGGTCLCCCQLPFINSLLGSYDIVLGMMLTIFIFLYVITLVCMVYCSLADPGTIKVPYPQAYTAMEEVHLRQGNAEAQPPLPKRARKTWLYRVPVRRYDHYCRWVTNCIGLANHREFFVMCTGLVTIAVLGTATDLIALIPAMSKGTIAEKILVLLHFGYSLILMFLAGPILKVHIGLVSRNELAAEWKRNDFYVIRRKHGETVPVNDLSDDEFNAKFDTFEYDTRRNIFDHGCANNWWSFWCIPRWPKTQKGEF